VRVALDAPAALYLTFEFADAGAEMVVELMLLDELPALTVERGSGACKFFREACDLRRLSAADAGLGVRDPSFYMGATPRSG
jgi:hypothetical protein